MDVPRAAAAAAEDGASDRVRAAEVVATLSLATDLGIGVPLEHGLHSTLVAMRLADKLGVDSETAAQTYYTCLLFYIGCTANADFAAEVFGADDALTTYSTPVRFGSRAEMTVGMLRAVAPPSAPVYVRGYRLARWLPTLAREFGGIVTAICEVARMLTDRLGLPSAIQHQFAYIGERWDGTGQPHGARENEVPLPVRIVLVARDAAFQRMLGGPEEAVDLVRERAGGAFDPMVAAALADNAGEVLALDLDASAWDETLDREPHPRLALEGAEIDRALAAMGDFADLMSPYLAGHSSGVARLAATAAQQREYPDADCVVLRRAAFVHDLGRVAVPARVWQQETRLTPDDWERVRLHPYYSERVLDRSEYLATLAPVASCHHERLDGTGYHRGATAASLTPAARLLAAADAYHAKTEPRPHRAALSPPEAAELLGDEARDGRLDPDSVSAVLEAAGQQTAAVGRPAGLTEREAQVVGLLARGRQTKQIGRDLGISTKTADHHIQNAYRKMGVSTRAAAALFAMEHGLVPPA